MALRSNYIAALLAQQNGALYDFRLRPTLTALGFLRTGLGTLTDSAGNVAYGPHNLLRQSNNFSDAAWLAKTNVTLTGGVADPFGGTNATTITASGGSGRLLNSTPVTPLVAYTGGLYIRRRSGTGNINWEAFAVGIGSAIPVTDAWTRLSVTDSTGGTTAYFGINIATPGDAFDICFAQFNVGTSLADYVPTTTSPVYLPRIQHSATAPHIALGALIEPQATQLAQSGNLGNAFIAQTKTVTATVHTFSFYGTGSVVLSGAHSATVNGTGANVLTSLTFTPSAGGLTMTPSGTVTDGQLEAGSVATSRIPNPNTGSLVRSADGNWDITGAQFTALWGEPTYGPELVANGDFASGTGWSLSGGGGGSAVISGGELTLIGGSATFPNATQAGILVSGKRYRITIDVTTAPTVSNVLSIRIGGGTTNGPTNITTTGVHSFDVIADGPDIRFLRNSGFTDTVALNSVSVKEVTSERTIIVEWWDTGAASADIAIAHLAGSISESIGLYKSGSVLAFWSRAGGVNQFLHSFPALAIGRHKAAFSFGPGGFAVSVDGGTPVTGTGVIPAPTTLRISGSTLISGGAVQQVTTSLDSRPTAITGAALQALSAL